MILRALARSEPPVTAVVGPVWAAEAERGRDHDLWQDDRVTTTVARSGRTALAALIGVSLAGSVDVAQFLATRTSMFTDAPSRAAGSVLGLVFWLALLGVATARYTGRESRGTRGTTLALTGLVAAGNVGLTVIHLKAGIGGWRPMLGGILGVLALSLALASRSESRD